MAECDVLVIGAGIVGLATSLALMQRMPHLCLVVVDKEEAVSSHQTGHNSGVIHSGVYYKPGSLKAQLCTEGVRRLTAFCDEHGVRYVRCGKVIVATEAAQLGALDEIYGRGKANGVPGLTRLGPEALKEIEPNARGVAALHLPETSIIDYQAVSRAILAELEQRGGSLRTGSEVLAIHRDGARYRVETRKGEVSARFLINCAGLYSDVVARKAGVTPAVQIIPFRGEYYFVRPERIDLVRGLIYPVPDPHMPFLGVHFTRTVHGELHAGPNAVLAFAREGYTKSRVHPGELFETLAFPGFWRMAGKFWRPGLHEIYRSFSRGEFVRALQSLVPAIQDADVIPGAAGVRAQAVSRDGKLVDDFAIHRGPDAIHVLNAPSPAATACLAIGEYVAGLALQAL